MKINSKYNPPKLWDWIKCRLPRGLEAKAVSVGYGYFCGIYRTGMAPGLLARTFECIGDPVASVSGREIELNYPEWYSDFEDLLRRFESETQTVTTLNYWQSSKDEVGQSRA